ncbi:MAG: hypothetical protein C4B55_02675 [Candidatus Methanophagaceae archaeon]|nr:MAG: hypothetical protein C4B55_02675 [Methanophagales archaeon]
MAKRCFVIMPFSATTPEHTAAYWDKFFLRFVKPLVEGLGYGCSRSKAEPSNIIKDILKELCDADLVLAVLTDYNANVWYELGIRHALRRGTIMMIEEGQELPFDISLYGVIKYENTIVGAADFKEELRSFVRRIEVEKPADSAVSEFLGVPSYKEHEYPPSIPKPPDKKPKLDLKFKKIKEIVSGGERWYIVKIFIEGEKEALDKIKEVEYKLHPTFKRQFIKSNDRKSCFSRTIRIWGSFTVRAKVLIQGDQRDETIELARLISFKNEKGKRSNAALRHRRPS